MKDVAAKLRTFWNDPVRKPLGLIAYELARATWQEREWPVHYLSRCLYRRPITNYLDYIGNRRVDRLHARLHAGGSANESLMLDDKLFFQLLFERAGIRVPRLLGHNCRTLFHDGTPATIATLEAFHQVLHRVVEHSTHRRIFIKPRDGMQGKGTHLITAEMVEDREMVDSLHQEIIGGSFLFQEALQQHPLVSAIYPPSINTIRMDTFVHDDGRAEALTAFIRFGGDGRYVDNVSQGGCFVGIDFQTGYLNTPGMQFLEHGGRVYQTHPNTGFRFEGFQVPFFEEAKLLVTRAALVAPGSRLVGWDVAILPDGPAIIEGNDNYGKSAPEMAYGGYRRHPTFARILDEFVPL